MDYTTAIHELRLQHYSLVYATWYEHLFTPQWMLLASLVIGMYTVWWLLVDKTRLRTLLLYGSLVAVARVIIDTVLAINLGRWVYSVTLLPVAPDFFVHDLTVTPLTYMMVFQYSHTWMQFWAANLIGSGLIFYGLLPLFEYLKIFQGFPGWTLTNSFLAIFFAAGVMRAIIIFIERFEKEAQSKVKRSRTVSSSLLAQPVMKPSRKDNGDNDDKE